MLPLFCSGTICKGCVGFGCQENCPCTYKVPARKRFRSFRIKVDIVGVFHMAVYVHTDAASAMPDFRVCTPMRADVLVIRCALCCMGVELHVVDDLLDSCVLNG